MATNTTCRGSIACSSPGGELWFYAAKLAWPFPVIFSYPRWTIDAHAWWQYLYPAAALAAIVALWLVRIASVAGRWPPC